MQIPNQIQIGLEKSLTIANALNQFQFYFVKSHFRKGKDSNISTRLTNNYVKILAKSDVLEEQRLEANCVNICDKDGLTNL